MNYFSIPASIEATSAPGREHVHSYIQLSDRMWCHCMPVENRQQVEILVPMLDMGSPPLWVDEVKALEQRVMSAFNIERTLQ